MKLKVAVVGATGIAGQQFLVALESHPWFELTTLAGSQRSAGKPYQEALKSPAGQINWWPDTELPDQFASMIVENALEIKLDKLDIVFVAVESSAALQLEQAYGKILPTISTASAHRMFADVPLFIPGVNDDHRRLIASQQKKRGWQGFVVPIPNCTTYGLAASLKPIQDHFGIKTVVMTSLQATSGAGRHGGILALDMLDNLVPYIPGEEEKVEVETKKILGQYSGDGISDANWAVSCTCTRVPVTDGHTETVVVHTERPCPPQKLAKIYREYTTGLEHLPSSPSAFYHVHTDPFHPQPRLDREKDGGMTTHIGRIREDPAMGGVKFVLLSHNTKAGAAKGALMVAETLIHHGVISSSF